MCKEQHPFALRMASWFPDRSVTRSYYRGAAGALLVYDIARFLQFFVSFYQWFLCSWLTIS